MLTLIPRFVLSAQNMEHFGKNLLLIFKGRDVHNVVWKGLKVIVLTLYQIF